MVRCAALVGGEWFGSHLVSELLTPPMRLPIRLGLCFIAAACTDGSSSSSASGTPVDPQPVATRVVPFALRSSGIDYAKHLTTDAVGRVFVTGYFAQSVDFDPSSGTASRTSNGVTDIFLASYEATGVLRWVTSLGGAGVDMTYAVGAETDGTLRVAGYVSAGASCDATLPSGGARDAFAAVFNASGRCTSAITIGGSEDDEARGFLIAPDGDWVIAGAFRGTADFDPGAGVMTITSAGEEDLFVARYSPSGSLRWVRTLGSTAGDEGMALSLDEAGNVYIGGFIGGAVDADPGPATVPVSTAGQGDAVVWALSATGVYRWLARWGGPQLDLVNVGELVPDADGSLVVSGTFRGLADLDPGSGVLTAAAIGSSDVFFLRLRRGDGSLVRAASIGGAGLDGSHTLRINAATGDILSAGWFTGSIDVDPGSGVRTLSGSATSGGTDIWVAQLDRNFTARWGTALTTTGAGETSWSMCTGAAYGFDGAVWLTGRYYGTLDAGSDTQGLRVTLANAGESDAFVARLTAADGRLWPQ
jgi:hypothetical protein